MSETWYLTDEHNFASGYETDDFSNYAKDGFNEVLNSFIGADVVYYKNALLNKKFTTKIIVQNVKSKENDRQKLLSTIGEMKTGYILEYLNRYWIINTQILNNGFYDFSEIKLCPYFLKFQLNSQIYNYPYYVESNSPSLDENRYQITTDTTRKIKLPFDDVTKQLCTNMRFMGDTFGGVPQCWKLTDLNLDGGLLQLTLQKDEYNGSTDNIELGLCDYEDFSPIPTDLIINGNPTIKKMQSSIYTSNKNVVWSLSNLDESKNVYAELLDITGTSVTVKANDKAGKWLVLNATSSTESVSFNIKIIGNL